MYDTAVRVINGNQTPFPHLLSLQLARASSLSLSHPEASRLGRQRQPAIDGCPGGPLAEGRGIRVSHLLSQRDVFLLPPLLHHGRHGEVDAAAGVGAEYGLQLGPLRRVLRLARWHHLAEVLLGLVFRVGVGRRHVAWCALLFLLLLLLFPSPLLRCGYRRLVRLGGVG